MSETIAQVGGSHYNNETGNAHWDLVSRFDLEYLPATASKYVARWDLKNSPILDLGKAISYIEKKLTTDAQWGWTGGCKRTVPHEFMAIFFEDNGWTLANPRSAEKMMLFELIHVDGSNLALRAAISTLRLMLERETAAVPTVRGVAWTYPK
jgi:hypothetical protein